MLSKPLIGVVGGQQRAAVDVERQQVADRVGVFGSVQAVDDGCGPDSDSAAARDRARSRATTRQPVTAAAVRPRPPAGGIAPARSFRTTFSQICGLAATSPARLVERQPGRLSRSLWQVTQYVSSSAMGLVRPSTVRGCRSRFGRRQPRQQSPAAPPNMQISGAGHHEPAPDRSHSHHRRHPISFAPARWKRVTGIP